MLRKTIVLLLAAAAPVAADGYSGDKLAFLIPGLYGPSGLIVDSDAPLPNGQTHSAHFNGSFTLSFSQLNVAQASQLASVPIASPASGFTYAFDPGSGVFTRSTNSFGPIVADRAETIGRGKFMVGFSYQRFSFDTIEGMDLDSLPAVFTHDDYQLGGGRADIVTTVNNINLTQDQFTTVFGYGLLDRFDVSLAVPVVRTDLAVTSTATIQRVGTGQEREIHYFRDASGNLGDTRVYTDSGEATGIGDMILRIKGTALRRGSFGLALAADFRFPTGDEENLLGSGAMGIKPYGAVSWSHGRLSPHLNVGYEWNGDSVLAGDILSGTKGDFPDQFLYTVGADVGVNKRLTLAFDFLGNRVIDSPRAVPTTFTADNGQTFSDLLFEKGSFNQSSASVGIKANAGARLLVDFNILFRLDDNGLRDRATPLVGVEYNF
ncbi:MAG: hypothetical protein AB1714_21215 [Acidobacteriota bacterium]